MTDRMAFPALRAGPVACKRQVRKDGVLVRNPGEPGGESGQGQLNLETVMANNMREVMKHIDSMRPKPKKARKRRWVLGEGFTCQPMDKTSISLWNEWGQFGPKKMLRLALPADSRLDSRYRLWLEEV